MRYFFDNMDFNLFFYCLPEAFTGQLCTVHMNISKFYISLDWQLRESLPQFENQIMAWVYVKSIKRSTMYQKASFC